ncbi:MAG: transcriptional regulator GlxA family with amidase domain [Desulforhopalus sp.]|jgi:transcriptional regulator GlxA family with amidase domain
MQYYMLKIGIIALYNSIHSTVTGPYDIFSIAASQSVEQGCGGNVFCSVEIVTPDESPVISFNSLSIMGTTTLKENKEFDIIITPAIIGDYGPILKDKQIIEWLRSQHDGGACLCSICASAFLVAQTGLLKGRNATTHWALAEKFICDFPEVHLKPEKMLVDDGDIISAGGVTAYLDLCIYILKRFGSPALASSVSKSLLIDSSRQTQTPYSSYTFLKNHGDAQILLAQDYIEERFNLFLTISYVAKITGLEERTFNRRFKKSTGDTPTEYIQGLRIEAARKLLETSQESVEFITQEVGYEDTSSFRRLFKKHTGLSPSEYRKRFSLFYIQEK